MADLSRLDPLDMVADSLAVLECEIELLENRPPSIKSASRRYLSKIAEAAATRPNAAKLLLDEHEDGMWPESKVTRKMRLEWGASTDAKSRDGDNDIGMGGVIVVRLQKNAVAGGPRDALAAVLIGS